MATSADETTRSLEEHALRAQGMLGRSGPYGNALFAFEYDQLPKDAKITIELIARGGPFPYTEDGGIYHNLSRDLPGISSLYREFTVLTPMEPGEQPRLRQDGKPHRGKRRILAKANGILFFTVIHYDRVKGILESPVHAQAIAKHDEEWRNGFYLITGINQNLRRRISEGIIKVHNSRLPAAIRSEA